MPGRDVSEIPVSPPFWEDVQEIDIKDEVKRIKALEQERRRDVAAKIQALEEREKLWTEHKQSMLNEVQGRLRQEMEKAGLIEKETKDEEL
jgi:hypothetical protein